MADGAQLVNHLQRNGQLGCPICGQASFTAGPERYSRESADKMVADFVCDQCGHVMTFEVDKLP